MSDAEKEASEIISKSYEHLSEPIGIIRPALMKNISDALKRRDERIKELEKLIEWHKQDTSDAMKWKRELESALFETRNRLKELVESRHALDRVHLEKKAELEAKLEAQNKVVEAARKYKEHPMGVEGQYRFQELTKELTALDKPSGDK